MSNSADFVYNACNILGVIGNSKRLEILQMLMDRELPVGEIARRIGLSQSSLSQHLALMRAAGLVKTRRQSQTIFYTFSDDRARTLVASLQSIYSDIE